MEQRRILLAKWMPDLPDLENPGLRIAKNCVPRAIGYGPLGSLAEIGTYGALNNDVLGAISLKDVDGDPENFAGTATKLYRIGSGAWADVTNVGAPYAVDSGDRWEFDVFQSNATGRKSLVIAVTPNEEIQAYEIGTSTEFEDLSGDAPKARHLGVIGQHVMFGRIEGYGDGLVPNRVAWPALGNASSWPDPIADPDIAAQAQSGFNTLYGNHGEVTGIVGGQTWGAIFQEKCVRRADYVGGAIMFDISKPVSLQGLATPGLACSLGDVVLFYSQDGWHLFDGSVAKSIGEGVLDDWFRREFQWDLRHKVSIAVDPERKVVHIGFPGIGATTRANRILHYNWVRNAWAYSECDHDYLLVVTNPGPNLSMDRTPSPIPDLLSGSWDDVQTSTMVIGGFLPTHKIAAFNGPNPAARFETGALELVPGRRALMSHVRPIFKGGVPTISVAKLDGSGDTPSYSTPQGLGGSMKCDARAEARYHALALDLEAGWTGDVMALDAYYQATGSR